MFDREVRWFICCDTCPDDETPWTTVLADDKDEVVEVARKMGWEVRDDLHRCPRCVGKGRTERRDGDLKIAGIKVKIDPTMPRGELELRSGDAAVRAHFDEDQS
jgi:hypothetical protein